MPKSEKKKEPRWKFTRVPSLLQNTKTGEYVSRLRRSQPPYNYQWHRLGTTVFSIAEVRHADFVALFKKSNTGVVTAANADITLGELTAMNLARRKETAALKPSTKIRDGMTLKQTKDLCRGFEEAKARTVTAHQVREWDREIREATSVSSANKCVLLIKAVFKLAIDLGVRADDPAAALRLITPPKHHVELPTLQQFEEVCRLIEGGAYRQAKLMATMARALAYSGLRIGEIAWLRWEHIDFAKGLMKVVGDPITGCKSGRAKHRDKGMRIVQMIPPMKALLEGMPLPHTPGELIFSSKTCRHSLDTACKTLGIVSITHHALRHLFTTVCIESGIDLATVAGWLGHRDGGKLIASTYHHLRADHAERMAAKVTFGIPTPPSPSDASSNKS